MDAVILAPEQVLMRMRTLLSRTVLTLLMWGLLLEILTIAHYVLAGRTGAFEFSYTLLLTAITLVALVIVLRYEAKALSSRTKRM